MASKTLIIVIHPDLENSKVSSRWIHELKKFPEKYVVHDLYGAYPDGRIDVKAEQELIESFDKIIFQFPFFWFNCPPLLKQWLDEVLLYGWAFGSDSGYKLGGKKIALAVSAGIEQEDYHPEGKYKYTMEQLLAPFELTFDYVRADYRPAFIMYGLEFRATAERIENSVLQYLEFLDSL